jgi:asparagine synthase (glutamine-hydrolysing)
MCGILAVLALSGNPIHLQKIEKFHKKGRKRGPEFSTIQTISQNIVLGFHRLAINGLNVASNQPIILPSMFSVPSSSLQSAHHDDYVLVCNGEIYNHTQLAQQFKFNMTTNSDCEVILHLYRLLGTRCFDMLDGVFACVIVDKVHNHIIVSRDPYGVRPLYECVYSNGNVGYASDIEPLLFDKDIKYINQFEPGCYQIFSKVSPDISNKSQYHVHKKERYFNCNKRHVSVIDQIIPSQKPIEFYMYTCLQYLKRAIYKRVENCERDIGCLLSGGLDSSIVSAYVSRFYREKTGRTLKTYSIGLNGATDFVHAQDVATHINSDHTPVTVTTDFFLESIPSVIKDIESYDTTTVRASVGNWNIGKYIREHSDVKVVFNGDGADELMGGYMYFHCAPSDMHFHDECVRLLEEISYFDVLRSDKSISSHGLEPRTPFLDKEFTTFYLSIPIEYRNHVRQQQCEKYFIRKSIELYEPELLPKSVLWRTKEAFSDGVSSQENSWHHIIHSYLVNKQMIFDDNIEELEDKGILNKNMVPTTVEQRYYHREFLKHFGKCCINIHPHYWMPKFVKNATDSSARTLEIYQQKSKNK